jgi:hypothetical protein
VGILKDLITALLKQISGYLPLLFAVIARPRQNIPTLLTGRKEPLQDALLFCAITIAISFILQAPLLNEGHDFTTTSVVLMTFKVIEMLIFNAALLFMFKLIGGTGSFEQTFVASLYVISPAVLFSIIPYLAMLGIISGFDPILAEEWRLTGKLSEATTQAMVEKNMGVSFVFVLLVVIQIVLVVGWFLYCWPVYTRLHGLGRVKAILSYLLAFILFIAVRQLASLIMQGQFFREQSGMI